MLKKQFPKVERQGLNLGKKIKEHTIQEVKYKTIIK